MFIMPLSIKLLFATNLVAFISTGAIFFYFGKKIANDSDGFRRGFAISVGLFGLVTVIDVNNELCPPRVASEWLKLRLAVYMAFFAELIIFAFIGQSIR